jgi:hypothetical protein
LLERENVIILLEFGCRATLFDLFEPPVDGQVPRQTLNWDVHSGQEQMTNRPLCAGPGRILNPFSAVTSMAVASMCIDSTAAGSMGAMAVGTGAVGRGSVLISEIDLGVQEQRQRWHCTWKQLTPDG